MRNKDSGFTLIELAIVIAISGLMFAYLFSIYKVHIIQYKYDLTRDNVKTSKFALFEFISREGRYPCPADPSLAPSDPNYGLELCRDITNDCEIGQPDTGEGGIGVRDGIICNNILSRDADGDSSPETVMMGMLPINTILPVLKVAPLANYNLVDGYGNRLSYAVTEIMTDNMYNLSSPVLGEYGGIRIEDEFDVAVTNPPASAHYVLFSHGINGQGSYSKEGVFNNDCMLPAVGGAPPAPPPTGRITGTGIDRDKENCDRNDALFTRGLRSMAVGDSYYDDYLSFTAESTKPLWVKSNFSPCVGSPPICYTHIYNNNIGNVGVGIENPTAKLHINGDANIEGGVNSDIYCDDDVTDPLNLDPDCLDPEFIGGDDPGNDDNICNVAGQAATGIEDNKLICSDAFVTVPTVTCPVGFFLNAISNIGSIRCCDNGNTCNVYP